MEDGRGGAVEDGVFGYYAPSSPSSPPSTTLGGGGWEWWIDCDDETDAALPGQQPSVAGIRTWSRQSFLGESASTSYYEFFMRDEGFFLLILTYGRGCRAAKRRAHLVLELHS